MRRGAFNYLQKPVRNAELLATVQQAIARDRHDRQTRDQLDAIRARLLSLTPREREILEGLLRGCANKTMAEEMRLSPRTVELHRARVMEKMGATSVAQLVRDVAAHSASRPGEHP
jgi:FixJ family two-component response regulator